LGDLDKYAKLRKKVKKFLKNLLTNTMRLWYNDQAVEKTASIIEN
jgi:hypothetical protein